MFAGIVQFAAPVKGIEGDAHRKRFHIDLDALAQTARVGDSICISGVCLTLTAIDGRLGAFDVITETLRRTNLGALGIGSLVNLESSMRLGDAIGGHFVTGHVDAQAEILDIVEEPGQTTMWIAIPDGYHAHLVEKGSVALDGISLTVAAVQEDRFSVCLIPHTLDVTTLGKRRVGETLNIETDMLAKYVVRYMALCTDRRPASQAGCETVRTVATEGRVRRTGHEDPRRAVP